MRQPGRRVEGREVVGREVEGPEVADSSRVVSVLVVPSDPAVQPEAEAEAERQRLGGRGVGASAREAMSGLPGADLLGRLTDLVAASGEPESGLSVREWVEAAVASKAMVGFCEALHLVCVRELDRAIDANAQPGAARTGATSVAGRRVLAGGRRAADELAPALGVAPRTATALVTLARRVEDDLPAAADALAEGRMNVSQVRVLDQVTRDLPTDVVREVEQVAVLEAHRRTTAQLRVRLEGEAARLDPEFHAAAAERGIAERDVQLRPSPLPGCRRLLMDLPALHAVAAWHALNGAAHAAKTATATIATTTASTATSATGNSTGSRGSAGRTGGAGSAGRGPGVRPDGTVEDRSLPQLRADLATAILTGQLTGDAAGGGLDEVGAALRPDLVPVRVPSGAELTRFAQVEVVVALATLTGAADLPAHLVGVGPLDTDTATTVARTAPLRRLIADPGTGVLLHRDTHTHPPPAPLAAGAAAVAGGTAAPGADGGEDADPRLRRLVEEPATGDSAPGTAAYRPGARLRAHVHTRDQTCIGPACEHTTRGTDLDHTINYGEVNADSRAGTDARVGTTTNGNLGSPCRRAHDSKTHGGWHLHQPTPGAFVWTSPTGRAYRVDARPLVPGWTHRSGEPSRVPP